MSPILPGLPQTDGQDDARRSLRRAQCLGERRDAGLAVVERGLDPFGAPIEADAEELGPVELSPDDIRLIACEDLVPGAAVVPEEPAAAPQRLFG